jgi:uncharacterized surface protein with fasciclin (FAS1) repeats
MKHLRFFVLLLVMVLGVFNAFAQDDTIADIVAASAEADEAEFTTLLKLAIEADLVETLSDEEAEYTVFAPTDAAFETLLEEFELSADDLLAAPDLISAILLYHVVEGAITAEELAELEEIETLQGNVIAVSVDDDGNVLLDDTAMVVTADIEASNGIIHVIDAVLLPPDDGAADSAEACIISTSEEGIVQVRVGPGNNRSSVSFLPANQDFEPLGQSVDDEGNVWYQLDKETAAPGRAINEAWVAAEQVDTAGDCSAVDEAAAPPIIPIIPAAPPANTGGGGDTGGGDTGSTGGDAPATDPNTLPASGTYTLTLAGTSNVSCAGTSSVPFPSTDLYNSLSIRVSVSSSQQAIILGGDTIAYAGPGYYTGQFTLGGDVVTIEIFTGTSRSFTGRINLSFTIDGRGCSAGTGFSASR